MFSLDKNHCFRSKIWLNFSIVFFTDCWHRNNVLRKPISISDSQGNWIFSKGLTNDLGHKIEIFGLFILWLISIITLMIIENRAPWLVRRFAISRYNHRGVIITLKARSSHNGSQIFWCFGVGNWSILLFSRIIINAIILKQLVA